MKTPRISGLVAGIVLLASAGVARADAPAWMHSLVNAPLPPHDEKTDAVELYSEVVLTVQSNGKIKQTLRKAFRILRPGGKGYGMVHANFDSESKVDSMHGWCIPASGKDYEVKDKDALETSLFGVQNGELVTDLKTKILEIPASDPGNIVGYEIEQEVRPYVMQDIWDFQQREIPVREAHYKLQLPAGWEYKVYWLNHDEVKTTDSGSGQHEWVVTNVQPVRPEEQMPPIEGIASAMIVSLFPPSNTGTRGFQDWNDMGRWQDGLNKGRTDASPEIK